jgi:hypothetical protein
MLPSADSAGNESYVVLESGKYLIPYIEVNCNCMKGEKNIDKEF